MVRILLKKYINSFITDNQNLDILYGGANIGLPRWLGVLAIAPPCDNYLIFSFFLAHSEKELVACVHAQWSYISASTPNSRTVFYRPKFAFFLGPHTLNVLPCRLFHDSDSQAVSHWLRSCSFQHHWFHVTFLSFRHLHTPSHTYIHLHTPICIHIKKAGVNFRVTSAMWLVKVKNMFSVLHMLDTIARNVCTEMPIVEKTSKPLK